MEASAMTITISKALPTVLIAVLCFFIQSGCRQQETTSAVTPRIEPASIDFGWVQTPPIAPFTTAVRREVTIINPGRTELSGQVNIRIEGDAPNAPDLALTRPDNPQFTIPPGDSLVFEFTMTVATNTSDGVYSGTIDFGPAFGSIPLTLRIRASQ
jgi:hypothetical protein